MKKSTRIFGIALCLILCLSALAACGSTKLSSDFNEEEVKAAAEAVISFINNEETEALLDMATVAVKNALTDEVMAEIYEAIGEGGDFGQILDITVGGHKDKASKEEFAIAVAKTEYEHKNFIYTLTFTKQMKLAGLFYK